MCWVGALCPPEHGTHGESALSTVWRARGAHSTKNRSPSLCLLTRRETVAFGDIRIFFGFHAFRI